MRARIRSLFSRLVASLWPLRLDRDLNEEVQNHLSELEDRFVRQGFSREEARFAARRAFGGVDQLKEQHREQRAFRWIENLRQDVRFAYRNLSRDRAFAFMAVCTLALGIGAVTTMFTAVNTVLIRPLPYAEPDRLVQASEFYTRPRDGRVVARVPEHEDWHYRNSVFESLTFYQPGQAVLYGSQLPELVSVVRGTSNLFSVLRREPWLGRSFAGDDTNSGTDTVAVVSYAFWEKWLHGADSAISRTIQIDNTVLTVIGVMPREFRFPMFGRGTDVWIATSRNRLLGSGRPLGRLKAGVSVQDAAASINAIMRQLDEEFPETKANRGVQIRPLFSVGGSNIRVLLLLSGAVIFVLLIAMVNVASLKLSHAVTRAREVAIRSALGAGRSRLIRQFLVESTMISSVAGAFGLLLAYAGTTWLTQWMPRGFPRATEIGVDANVFLFVLAVSIVVAIGFGIVPAITCSKPDLTTSLKDGARTASEGRSRRVLRHSLIAGEIALTTVLLTGAGLMAKSFWNVLAIPIGFDPDRVVVADFQFPCPSCETFRGINANPAQQAAFVDGMLQRLQSSPEVESVSFTTVAPLMGSGYHPITIEGIPNDPQPVPMSSEITAEFFKTLAIPLESGRPPARGEPAVVINKTMAETYWPNRSPLGGHLKLGDPGSQVPWMTIVGVAEDYKNVDILQTKKQAQIFSPCQSCGVLLLKTKNKSTNVEALVRGAVLDTDKTVLVASVRDLNSVFGETASFATPRFQTALFNLFAGMAFLLVIVGVFAVTSYAASRRTQEVGIRMSFGASRSNILRLMMRQSLVPACFGLLLGVLGSFALTRLLTSQLFGVKPTDPWVFAGSAALVLVVVAVACFVPIMHATAVDPLAALRDE